MAVRRRGVRNVFAFAPKYPPSTMWLSQPRSAIRTMPMPWRSSAKISRRMKL